MQSQQIFTDSDCDPVEARISKFAESLIDESKRDTETCDAM